MVNEADLDWTEHDEDKGTRFRRKRLAAAADGEALGASLYELDPGEQSWPVHFHTGNEEAVYVLAGEGTVKRGEGRDDVPLEPGEFVAFPADPSGAHRIVNTAEPSSASSRPTSDDTGTAVLRYLMVSTMNDPDVAVYPEHDGIGVFAGAPPGGDGERVVSGFWNREDAVEYWD
jgi:uncharacterized cupin superfamily protein